MSEPLIAYWFAMADEQGRAYSPNKPDERWEVGQTRTLNGEIIPCRYGFHGSPTLWQALKYAPGPIACKVELSGTIVQEHDKLAASQKTLLAAVNVERELQLFAADCAEHVLDLFELECPNDDRPRKAIAAARGYADGRIDYETRAAESAAAMTAASATVAKPAPWPAAMAAAMAAASAAASAARAARHARDAVVEEGLSGEHEWQRQRFEELLGGIFSEGSA